MMVCACVNHMILIGHGLNFSGRPRVFFGNVLYSTFYEGLTTETRSKVQLTLLYSTQKNIHIGCCNRKIVYWGSITIDPISLLSNIDNYTTYSKIKRYQSQYQSQSKLQLSKHISNLSFYTIQRFGLSQKHGSVN